MTHWDEYSMKQYQFQAIHTPYWKDRIVKRRTRDLQSFQDIHEYQELYIVPDENGTNSPYMGQPNPPRNIPTSPFFNKSKKRDKNINNNISVLYPMVGSKRSFEPDTQAQLATQIVLDLLPSILLDQHYGRNEFDFAEIYVGRDDRDSESATTEHYSHINNINVHATGQGQAPRSPLRGQDSENRAVLHDNSFVINILRVTAYEHNLLESLSNSPQSCMQ